MVYLNLLGGLGNQIFEYAFAKSIAVKKKQDICIDTYEYSFPGEIRNPTIKMMNLPQNVTFTDKNPPWYVHRKNRVAGAMRKFFPELYFHFFENMGDYIWYKQKAVDIKVRDSKNTYISGFWQSEKYFRDAIPALRKELVPKTLTDRQKAFIKRVESEESIALHVRRGDYVGTYADVCTVDYYNKAVDFIRQKMDGTIYVFSDDIGWTKKNLDIPGKVHYVEENNPDYVELYIMSKCHSFIISNSTFSWWAQELGSREGKLVIAPSKWHHILDCRDIYLDSWHLIEV